jgi:heme o synthase
MKKKYLTILLKSGRWRLSIATALASAAGALAARPAADFRLAAIFMGSVFYALAVTWFNQIQERQSDSLMSRTKSRPLANNTLPVGYAIVWTILYMSASFLILFLCGGLPAPVILGVVTLFYNGIYTPMKRRSLFALIPGAFAGAAPPVLGWVCAGGKIMDSTPLVLFVLFFLWQVPHFWFTAERNSNDYDAIMLPLPWRVFGERFYSHLLLLWVMAFSVALLALPAFGVVHSAGAQLFVVFMSALSMAGLMFHVLLIFKMPEQETAAETLRFTQGDRKIDPSFGMGGFYKEFNLLSRFINFSLAAVCVVLVAEKIFGG